MSHKPSAFVCFVLERIKSLLIIHIKNGLELISCGEPIYINIYDCHITRGTGHNIWFGLQLKGI